MSEFAFEDIMDAFSKFKDSMEKEVEEIKKQKNEILRLRAGIYDHFEDINYITSKKRIVLSAPEIVIGNVDRMGHMFSSDVPSKIIIRGGKVQIQATGDADNGGTIVCKAATIKNIAVDPGVDGMEENLLKTSNIINQARTVYIESANDTECFVNTPKTNEPGLTIKSDSTLDIYSAVGDQSRTKYIDEKKAKLTAAKTSLTADTTAQQVKIKAEIAKLELLLSDNGALTWNLPEIGLRTFPENLMELGDKISESQENLYDMLTTYFSKMSKLVEVGRKLKALDKMKSDTSGKSGAYKTDSTKAAVNITSENINMLSADGDGNVRDNATAGLQIQAPHIKVATVDAKGALVKDSTIDINTKTYNLTTANIKYSDDKKRDAGEMPAEGDVIITSKNVTIQSVDSKLNAGKAEEEKLTAESTVKIRAEKVSMEATDKEGKATGSVKVNAKDLRLRSMDVDPKSGDEKAQAAGGQMMMLAEKMFVGSNSKKTKLVQVAAEKVGVIGKDTAELQQDGKAVVTLSGGNMTAGGSKVDLKGNTTIEGNADIKGETKSPKVTSDQVEAKSAFKSPNINDTMGAGVPGAAGKPSAAMTEEDAK